ncbi:Rdx family-domain-containing protein [Aspergillus desertorum]
MTEPTAPIETNPPTHSPRANYSKPRITIQYCTQCKWMLRAAYFAQELLSTFNTDIGEIALVPRTRGIFTVTIFSSVSTSTSTASDSQSNSESEPHFSKEGTILWDRKRDGGFPEVKELKSRVRNVIDPGRDLGHTDRALKRGSTASSSATANATVTVAASTGTGTGIGADTSTGAGTGARATPGLLTPIPAPSSASDPASVAARAKVGVLKSESGYGASTEPGTGTEPGTETATATPASLSAPARIVDETAGGTAQGLGIDESGDFGTTQTSASDGASLSARAKVVDETAGGAERKSDEEVCEDCV